MYYTNQKQLTDTETEEVIGIMLKPILIRRSPHDGTLVVSVSLVEEIDPCMLRPARRVVVGGSIYFSESK